MRISTDKLITTSVKIIILFLNKSHFDIFMLGLTPCLFAVKETEVSPTAGRSGESSRNTNSPSHTPSEYHIKLFPVVI